MYRHCHSPFRKENWRNTGIDEPIVEKMFGSGNPDRTILTLPLTSSGSSIGTDLGTGAYAGDERYKKKLIGYCVVPRSKAVTAVPGTAVTAPGVIVILSMSCAVRERRECGSAVRMRIKRANHCSEGSSF